MKNTGTEDESRLKMIEILRFAIYFIVVMFYGASFISLMIGVGVLVIVLIHGWVDIRDGQSYALGILIFFPLHCLRIYLERNGFTKLIRKRPSPRIS